MKKQATQSKYVGPTERAAVVVWLLAQGWKPTTKEVAAKIGLNRTATWRLLKSLANVIPVAQVGSSHLGKHWKLQPVASLKRGLPGTPAQQGVTEVEDDDAISVLSEGGNSLR